MKIIFLGTPVFASIVLQKLIDSKHEVVAVVCQPDKPVGRKQILEAPPVKVLANKFNIPVYQFAKIRKEGVEPLKALNADIMITAAYGQILSQEVLDITKFGTYNVHGSLLPKYRGAAPVQFALLNGEEKTGVTIMKTDAGIDTGDIICQESFPILEDDTVSSILEKIANLGANLLVDTVLDSIENNTVKFIKQDNSQATYYPMIKKESAKIDFNLTSKQIVNMVRGYQEWPVAFTYLDDKVLKVYSAKVVDYVDNGYQCGEIVSNKPKTGLIIKTLDGFVRLLSVQIEGGKILDDKSFLNGKKLEGKKVLM